METMKRKVIKIFETQSDLILARAQFLYGINVQYEDISKLEEFINKLVGSYGYHYTKNDNPTSGTEEFDYINQHGGLKIGDYIEPPFYTLK